MATTTTTTINSNLCQILRLLAIVVCCCCCYVQCQQQPQNKYQQMQYQLQQQQAQQYEYQQHMLQQQQQQQHYYQQQYAAAAATTTTTTAMTMTTQQPSSMALQQQQQQQLQQQQQTQMLKTGASLVVGDDEHDVAEQTAQKEYYASSVSDAEQPTRRRPGTPKRKRRPQVAPLSKEQTPYWRGRVEDDAAALSVKKRRNETNASVASTGRRRKQPAIREPLAALEKEQKLYELRDKQRQEYASEYAGSNRDKSYRRPYAQGKKEQLGASNADVAAVDTSAEAATSTAAKSAVNLKHILQNAGGLSLSEILQQQNLSLDDLLKGKQNALQALQTTATAPAQPMVYHKQAKPSRRVVHTQNSGLTPTGGSNVEEDTGSAEDAEHKQKLKFPALQRGKLFGSSSRAGTTQSGFDAANTRRREPSSSTTSTSSTITTTRMPLYKQRQQLRSTLKSPALFKVPPPVTTTTTYMETTYATATNPAIAQQEDADIFEDAEELREVLQEKEQEPNKAEPKKTTPAIELPAAATEQTTTQQPESQSSSTTERTLPPPATAQPTTAHSSTSTSTLAPQTKPHLRDRTTQENALNYIENDVTASKDTMKSMNEEQPQYDDGLENFFEEPSQQSEQNKTTVQHITPRIDRNALQASSSYNDEVPDFDGIDDRTDLLELIEDRRSGNRLFKVLEQRNMSLEELIEHRKRGSSQLHLATIVQNQSRLFPGQKVVLQDNMDIVTAFENFPHFNLLNLKSVKPDDIKTDSQGSSYFTSIIDIEPTDEVYKDGESKSARAAPKQAPIPARTDKTLDFFPSWKTLALASLGTTTHGDAATHRNTFFLTQPKLLLEEEAAQQLDDVDDRDDEAQDLLLLRNDTQLYVAQQPAVQRNVVEAIENEVARAHDLLDLELSGHGFKRSPAAAASMANEKHGNLYAHMPAGIRSAIVASSAIVLTSLVTFMVIFVICRWKQRRRRKTNYMKTYNAMKSKLPTITNASRRSSMRNVEELMDGRAVDTLATTPMHQLQRQSSLLFPRGAAVIDASGGIALGSSCTNSLLSGRGALGNSFSGMGSATGSTTSLALSLRSAQNISSTKLNTMDPSSPEMQEYLFDTLRKSY